MKHLPGIHWLALLALTAGGSARAETTRETRALLGQVGTAPGVCVVLGDGALALEVARATPMLVYVQAPDGRQVDGLREQADAAGLLGKRLFVEQGPWSRLHLADNLADAVLVRGEAAKQADRKDLVRCLRPGGKLLGAAEAYVKPFPEGTDEWTHPYHGPDNNPQSRDRLARAPYLTHFTAEPWYCPMPLMTVASGGRLFKAFGHVAIKEREWPWLNTLIAQNAFNGALLWKRPLEEGFMIHRNTLIATPETLYLGDNSSCKRIDPATGQVRDEIVVPEGMGGPSWKWMALVDGTLYALVGVREEADPTVKGARLARGWPWGGTALGRGYNSKVYPWGFGHTLLAIDTATKKVLWSHTEKERLDARATCLAAGRLFFYSHGKFLGALDVATGKPLWKTSDPAMLEALGEHRFAQNPREGFSSTSYAKCNERGVYFAGPTRTSLVAVSAADGKLLWQVKDGGNSQLVLRDEGLYAMGPRGSTRHDFLTGKVLEELGPRVNCTRATGSVDSIFVRGGRDGTVRYDLGGGKQQHMCPMRPSCQDGVLISYGHLYWGPWMCDCNLTLVGVVSLQPAGGFDFAAKVDEKERLEPGPGGPAPGAALSLGEADWPALRANNQRTAFSKAALPPRTALKWTYTPAAGLPATAPVAAGDLVFVGGRDGAVRALDAGSGAVRWTRYTGGALTYPPALAEGRLHVGSGDGWVYTLDARDGRLLWRFRAAPQERTIPVYGSLRSTWPVGSGVLAEKGTVYAAAGIANHDGTHVLALDAASGKLRWHNGTSGSLHPETSSGVSVNGPMLLHGGRLHLAGGNMVPVASYDPDSGRCLTDPLAPPSHTQFKAGSDLFVLNDRVVAAGAPLYSPPGDYRMASEAVLQTPVGDVLTLLGPHNSTIALAEPGTAGDKKARPRWVKRPVSRVHGLAVTGKAIVVAGSQDPLKEGDPARAVLLALAVEDGQTLWEHPLPAAPVSRGLAIDRRGQILTALQDGRVLCFGAAP